MSILTVNLKHFYQRRGAWLWYVLILCQTPVILMPVFLTRFDRYLGYLIASLLVGTIAGGMQKDVLIKPFSFCLPGHRYIARPFVFWIGGTVNLILGCVFLGYPELDLPYVLLVVLAAGFVGMIVYFYGVYIGFQVLPTPAGGIIPLFIFGAMFLKWDVAVQKVVINQPLMVILVSALVCIWVWRLLGRDFLARKYCGKLVVGIFGAWDRQKVEKCRQQIGSKRERKCQAVFLNWLGIIFHKRMERYDFLSTGRYVCGNIYTILGGCLRMFRPGIAALLTLGFVVYFGYLGSMGMGSSKAVPSMMQNFVYLFPALIVTNINLLPCQSLLVPAGRSQKFHAILVSAVVLTFLGVILLLALTMISLLFEGYLPDIKWHGLVLSYHAFSVRLLPLFVVFVPISFCISVFFCKNHIARMIIMMGLMQIIILTGVIRSLRTITFGPFLLATLAFVFWGLFLYLLHYVCMRRSLVGQGR